MTDIEELVELHRKRCNRYVNGKCTTRACCVRGGYIEGKPVDWDSATCEEHETATALSAQKREIAELRSERDAFEQSYRIRLWNELRSQGMKQDDAIAEISRQIDDLRKDAKDAALNTPSQEGEKR